MRPLVARAFLFLLLACDWAGDPYLGRSPLSRPLRSQEVICQTIRLPGDLDRNTTLAQPPALALAVLALDLPAAGLPPLPTQAPDPTDTYARLSPFLALRC
jgi:hypothetical protein